MNIVSPVRIGLSLVKPACPSVVLVEAAYAGVSLVGEVVLKMLVENKKPDSDRIYKLNEIRGKV